jgi:hypothetical protein
MLAAPLPSTLKGVLDEATVRKDNQIGLTTLDNQTLTLSVREGMDDLVRTYFNREVEVQVQHRDGHAEIVGVTGIDE